MAVCRSWARCLVCSVAAGGGELYEDDGWSDAYRTDDADESADELEAFDATHAPTLAFDPAPPRASPTLDTSRSEPVMTTAVAHTFEVTLSRAHEDPPPLYG